MLWYEFAVSLFTKTKLYHVCDVNVITRTTDHDEFSHVFTKKSGSCVMVCEDSMPTHTYI